MIIFLLVSVGVVSCWPGDADDFGTSFGQLMPSITG
jgi:hypothetical protein